MEALIAAYRRRCGGQLAALVPEGAPDPGPQGGGTGAHTVHTVHGDAIPVRMTREAMKKLRPVELLVLAELVRDGDRVHYKRRSGPVQAYGTIKCVSRDAPSNDQVSNFLPTGGPAYFATTVTRSSAAQSLSGVQGARCGVPRKTFSTSGGRAFRSCWGML